MNLNLSWDLFILVFFGVVIAYSFIIGRDQTLKVIASTYVAILCADAMGNLFGRYFAGSEAFLKLMRLFSVGNSEQAVAFFKVFILILLIVLLAVRGSFSFSAEDTRPFGFRLGITLVLGVLSAGLMMSAMLIFVSGSSLVSGITAAPGALASIYEQSRFVKLMIDYSNMWFFVPGLSILAVSFFSRKQ